jgi:hypothetical protein
MLLWIPVMVVFLYSRSSVLCVDGVLWCSVRRVLVNYRLSWEVTQACNQKALLVASFLLVTCLSYSSTLKTEANVPPKCRLNCTGLHGITFHMAVIFITTLCWPRVCDGEESLQLCWTIRKMASPSPSTFSLFPWLELYRNLLRRNCSVMLQNCVGKHKIREMLNMIRMRVINRENGYIYF